MVDFEVGLSGDATSQVCEAGEGGGRDGDGIGAHDFGHAAGVSCQGGRVMGVEGFFDGIGVIGDIESDAFHVR